MQCFLSFSLYAYDLLLLTHTANWSEPLLHRMHWPLTPTLLTVAYCQMGKSGCVCVCVYDCGQTAQDDGTKTQN